MKKFVFFTFCALMGYMAKAQHNWIVDSVSMGTGTSNDLFYSMSNGLVRSEFARNWHMAFTMSAADSSGVWANHGSGNNFTKVFNIHKDSSQWNSITAADTAGATVLFNNHDGWYSGAFNNMPGVNPFDFGWGKYDLVTHNIIGDSVFIVRVPSGYYKVWIKQLISTQMEYTVQVGNLTTNQNVTYTIARTPKFTNRLFAYLDLTTGVDTNREPNINDWDLLFTRYTTNAPGSGGGTNNNVIGALSNRLVKVARAYPVHVDSAYAMYGTYIASWTPHIAGVGYPWKTFDMATNTWNVPDSNSYFIEDRSGNLWQLQFTAYSGSASGNIQLRKRLVAPTSVNDVNAVISKYALAPNPANTEIQVLLDSKKAAAIQLSVYDLQGRVLWKQTVNTQSGLNAYSVPLNGFNNGQYILTIRGEHVNQSESFVVMH